MPLNMGKPLQIFLASGLWTSFITYSLFISLKSLCLQELFSSDFAINPYCKTEHDSTCQRKRWGQILRTKLFSCSQLKAEEPTDLCFSWLFPLFCLQWRRERIWRINLFFTESKVRDKMILFNTQYSSAVSVSEAYWISGQAETKWRW